MARHKRPELYAVEKRIISNFAGLLVDLTGDDASVRMARDFSPIRDALLPLMEKYGITGLEHLKPEWKRDLSADGGSGA